MAQVFRIMELNLKKHAPVLIGVGAFVLITSSFVIGTFLLSSKTDVTVNSTVTDKTNIQPTTENVTITEEHDKTGNAPIEVKKDHKVETVQVEEPVVLENTMVNNQLIGQSTSHSETITSDQNQVKTESNLDHTMIEKDYQNTNVAHNTTLRNSNDSNDSKNNENPTVNDKPTGHTTESTEQNITSNTATENNTALSNSNENTEKPTVNNKLTDHTNESDKNKDLNEQSSTNNTAVSSESASEIKNKSHISVAADDGKVHVTNKEQRKCGSGEKVFCGMFDISGLNLSGGKYRVFYAYENEDNIKKIIDKIENQDPPQNYYVKSIFGDHISYNDVKTGKTYYQTELDDHNYLAIDMPIQDTLDGVKKSGFIGFYNNLVGDDLDLWKSNDMFFIACAPKSGDFDDLTMFNAEEINLQKKGTEEAVVEEKLYSNIETMGWFTEYKFVVRAHKILSLFKQPNLIGIHIEFMKEEKSSKISADEFSSYAKFVKAKGNMKHSAYEGLNVYYNYGYNDWEITRVLDKIKAEGAKAEFTRQYGYGAHVFQPFQLLLVGSLEKLSKFTKYDEKDSKQILTV